MASAVSGRSSPSASLARNVCNPAGAPPDDEAGRRSSFSSKDKT